MTANELRSKYLQFFVEKGHAIISSASLIPENDPTVLFTTAGMHPLVPYLLGQNHPAGQRLTSAQKCIRTGDIDEVGDATHLTFFEMLGNWSLGDYFKKEAIDFSWEFLTGEKWLNISPERLAVTVFVGDNDSPFDQESYDAWIAKGVNPQRIAKLAKDDNWWPKVGMVGPCGPDTEMFYWTGKTQTPDVYDPEDKNWVEIWNNVFMSYYSQADGSFTELAQKNVDTGMGLERVLCVMNGISDIYQTELFSEVIKRLEILANKNYADNIKAFRVIADHVRAAVMIIGDQRGVGPSNVDQGYVVRKLIRRAVRFAKTLEIQTELSLSQEIAPYFINYFSKIYPEIKQNADKILAEMIAEEDKFEKTLVNGLKEFNKITRDVTGVEAFDLYQTFGFPLEMTVELAGEKGFKVDMLGFENEINKHQELSRTASAGKFKGGLADAGEETTKLHTATHLLQSALRKVLGDHVYQKGSNINAERLRFDFAHDAKMTAEQIAEVEKLVNQAIADALPVTCQEVGLDEAKAMGAMGVFESKYNDQVKVYTVGDDSAFFSREICGGPHVGNTSELKSFKILKEEASSAGVRRIKAVVGER